MRIDSSYIGMDSARRYSSVKTGAVRLSYGRILQGSANQTGFGQLLNTDVKDEKEAGETSDSKKNAGVGNNYLQERFRPMAGIKKIPDRELSSAIDKFREQCMRYIFDLLFGNAKKKPNDDGTVEEPQSFEEEFTYTEQETTSFSTVGTVKTADGREINFNLDVEMSRSFTQQYQRQYEMASVKVCDPLVINLDGDIAGLSDQKFFFDLDADGTKDEISMLEGGSGYLALDKNKDGTINDGSELFGTASGDGFADLAKYDEDGNGWIDEGDAIWDKLKIWCKDENGKDVLYKLAEKGVGAICLQRVGTQYSLNSQETNQTNGYIRSTGVFLYENGMAGTVQHVDIAKEFQAVG